MRRTPEHRYREKTRADAIYQLNDALERTAKLEAALQKIIDGPEGKYDHESGCPFERFACRIAYEALRKE
jgi:hypothetical protein